MTILFVMLNCFLTVSETENYSDSDLSLPPSQYAAHTDFSMLTILRFRAMPKADDE